MAPFVSPKTWFNKRGGSGSGNGSGSKKKKTTLSTTTSSSLTMTSFPLNSTNYHNKDPIYYTAPSTTTPTTVDIALALSKQRAYSSSPISPPGTTTSGTTTLVNSNITTTNYPSGRYMAKDAALLSPTSSTGGNGIASISLPHLPYNPMSSPEQTYIPRTTYKPKPSRSATASDDTPAAEVSNPWHKAQKLQELQNCIQSNHHQYQPPSKSFSSQPLPFPADSQPLQFANLSTTGETTKGSARARWFLNRARTNRNKSTQNLTQTQDHPMQEQQQQQKQPEHQLERQSSRGTFKGMAARFRSSSENVRALETVAQEYARTIKALWQMVAEEELSQRLADATPEEREWIILHHSNLSETSTLASCYFIPNQLLNANANASRSPYNRFSRESNGSEDSHTSGGNGSCNSRCNSRLSYVEPAYNYNKNHYTHHSQSDHFQAPPLSPIRESCHVHGSPSSSKPDSFETVPHHPQPTTMGVRSTFQESRRVHPDLQSSPTSKGRDTDRFNENDDSNIIQRRGTKVSEMVKQSAMELQKHDHYTLQQRIDMEEDWRLQAKLLQGNVEAAVRIQHSREHHNSLYAVHHHTTFPEYEPPEDDYDDKEELSENDPRLMSGIISAAAALASAQEVDPEKIAKYEEAAIRARSRRDYEDIERELKLLGLLRYEIGTESQLGSAFSEGDETSSEGVVDPEDPETMLGVAHKVGVFGVRRESRLMYHARDGSRQTVEVI
ncbi:hypothetical protein K457DRAFT_34828 [Linnemannia elongata AG-77]|uniref:Uncharacterized protein n=1 Tax=Linnemannia elongata AG-77 TaxID=1314771 RepID=A0A197JLU2_9FUNG|nr:hypothetical protein K457DRAFT_34828 [Linnemannia elongata AG-77]